MLGYIQQKGIDIPDRFSESGKEAIQMKGYYTSDGFWGYMGGHYVLFSSEADYYEMMDEDAA